MGVSQIGDGTLADLAVAREVDVCPIPEDMPTQRAATLPANYSTAYYALHVRAKVSAGEIVVVNGGAGDVGSAAIQLARAAGARVLADDLGESRAQLCLDFGAHVAVDVADEDLTAAIREFSDGKGADIVVDSVGGEAFVACRRAMASEGRLVVVGFTSGTIPQLKVNQLIFGNYTVMGVNAVFYTSAFRGVMEHLLELYTSGLITPPIDAQFPFFASARGLRPHRSETDQGSRHRTRRHLRRGAPSSLIMTHAVRGLRRGPSPKVIASSGQLAAPTRASAARSASTAPSPRTSLYPSSSSVKIAGARE
jgi:NADPH:quinone reductase-like Zn-dependent oxidoreductase